jgi:hypothetical protein
MALAAGSGYLLVDTVVDGIKLRPTAGNFNGGLIRVWGLSGGLWSSGFERPFA